MIEMTPWWPEMMAETMKGRRRRPPPVMTA